MISLKIFILYLYNKYYGGREPKINAINMNAMVKEEMALLLQNSSSIIEFLPLAIY